MAFLYSDITEVSPYLKARKKFYTTEAWTKMINALKTSTTLYIGNLSFYTDEEQVYTLFSICGPIRRVIMGIHKYTHLPCGFCFVEYYFHRDAMAARNYLNGTKLDDRIIRADLDPGFEAGRQFGRGTTGGQVRDDRRHEYDEGRGGLPPRHRQRLEKNAVESGTLIGPTSGPLNNNNQHRHRYERNMTVNNDEKNQNKQETQNSENINTEDTQKQVEDKDKLENAENSKDTDITVNNGNNNNEVSDNNTDSDNKINGTTIKKEMKTTKEEEEEPASKPPTLDHVTEPPLKKQRIE